MTETRSLSRLEAFSDGVFAIAITLLILEIKVPPLDAIHSASDLSNALIRQWPSFFAFLLTFGNILVQWVIHHNTFNFLDKTSRPLLYANGLLLLTIVFFPYPTALLAVYVNTEFAMPAIVFYGLASVLNGLGWFCFIRSMYRPKRLIKDTARAGEQIDRLKRSNRFAFITYASMTLLAIWLPYTALIINGALWILWISLSLTEEEKES
jgi:TMEM175 potassium channel family protein